MIRILISCAMIFSITAGCTQNNDGNTSMAKKALIAFGVQTEQARLQNQRFAQLVKAGAPTMTFGVENTGTVRRAVADTTRAGIQTWLINGGSFSTQDGFLRSTRGAGDDLMAADIEQTRAMVLGLRAGQATRTMAYVGAEDAIETLSFDCEITKRGAREISINGAKIMTTLMAEDCGGSKGTFGNLYWVMNATGQMVQSRQWGSNLIGPIVMRIDPNQ